MKPVLARKDEEGVVLITAFLVMAVIAGLSMSYLMMTTTERTASQQQRKDLTAFYAAEAGMNRAWVDLQNSGSGNIGSVSSPMTLGGAAGAKYWTTMTAFDVYGCGTLVAKATYSNDKCAVQAVVQKQGGGVYYNALFAGNSGGSITYGMKFGGNGTQADAITGDVYSGKNITATGTAKLTGTASVGGTISAANSTSGFSGGSTGVTEPIPDLASKNYASTADIKVLDVFKAANNNLDVTKKKSWTYGGSAWEVASTDPSRMFRLNPTDRTSQYQGVPNIKTNNFYLEDRFPTWVADGGVSDAAHAHQAQINDNANNKVFYIDGNLWVNNLNAMSFQFVPQTAGAAVKVTIVVSGNIYIGDNLYYKNATTDGLALIALKAGGYSDSGNIYFGDPNFGTLEAMQAFMYAENNFCDNNMGASGSAKVTVMGNMTAGNQVAINRDFSDGSHSKLTVNFDNRIKNGTLSLPNLPAAGTAGVTYAFSSWKRVKY